MGFFNKKTLGTIAGTALGGVGGGVLAHYWGDLNRRKGQNPPPPRDPLTAGQVGLIPGLQDEITAAGAPGSKRLENAFGRIQGRAGASQSAMGLGPGSYFGPTLGRAQEMGQRGIDDSLYGVLGGASLNDTIGQREHESNLALVNEIGDLNAPTTLEQILGGLGVGGKTAVQTKSLFDTFGSKKRRPSYVGDNDPGLADTDYGWF